MIQSACVVGDARSLPLQSSSVDLVVTSPPYFGLRAYRAGPGEIGQETRLADYLESMRSVLAEIQRVVKRDGSVFIVIGDKYVADNRGSGIDRKREHKHAPSGAGGFVGRDAGPKGSLMGIPARVALAAVDLGFLWRQEIVWSKPNPTPDPTGKDRAARSHETIIHLSLARKYYVNPGADRWLKDVWEIPVQGYKDPANRRHPAVFPEEIARRLVHGWSQPGGVVLDPFVGSGTTAAVAARLGRRAVGVDLSPGFASVASDRLSTGRVA
jgi:DNA modification methylase